MSKGKPQAKPTISATPTNTVQRTRRNSFERKSMSKSLKRLFARSSKSVTKLMYEVEKAAKSLMYVIEPTSIQESKPKQKKQKGEK